MTKMTNYIVVTDNIGDETVFRVEHCQKGCNDTVLSGDAYSLEKLVNAVHSHSLKCKVHP